MVAVTKVAPPNPRATGPLGPIQIIPPGLMGLLQLKQTGRLPGQLADVVAGVIELRDWYMTARRLDANGLFGTPTPRIAALVTGQVGLQTFQFAGAAATVPQGQFWWVEQYGVHSGNIISGDQLHLAMGVLTPQNQEFLQTGTDVVSDTTARTRVLCAKSDRGFWAFPGDAFAIDVMDVLSAGGIQLNMQIRATPCAA